MNIRVIAASALLAGAFFSTAQAQDREPTRVRVSTSGVDFSQPASVKALYGRLHRAALWACASNSDDVAVLAADRACADQALNRAVAEVNKPALLALHAERTGRPTTAPALLARN